MSQADIIQCAVVAGLCFVMIMARTLYRIFFRCKVHVKCHRQWHKDDIWMTFSLLPLIGRAITIAWSADLVNFPPGATDEYKKSARTLNGKLLMPGRIFYLTFLWCCKFCLLELYLRLSKGLPIYRQVGEAIRWSLYLTWIAVCLATFFECRPIQRAWNGDPAGAYCRKARGNLITMAACNIVTDLFLILFPISIIRRSGLDFYRLLRLSILFTLGSLVIITTVVRVPLILRDDAQKTRSLWASIEISIACFIAQAPFFQAVYVDRRLGQHTAFATSSLINTNGGISRSHITATHSRTQKLNSTVLGGTLKGEDDEIGLWTIEKRVSYSVSGRTRSSGELEDVGEGRGSERDRDPNEGSRREESPPKLGKGMGIIVSREVQISRDEEGVQQQQDGDERQYGGRGAKLSGGHSRRHSSRAHL